MDQLAEALINPTNGWDVDNDADGIPDSIWVDLGLPTFTSREGKLIRPLVAPMIEDLSARLNLNAHGNQELSPSIAGMTSAGAYWAGTTGAFGSAANSEPLFRGLGWGPAEVMLPAVSSSGAITNATIRANLIDILNERYRYGEQQLATPDVPGESGRDALDVLRFGYRPSRQFAAFGFGYSTDPFGRGGLAMGRSGHILAAGSGSLISFDNPTTTTVVEPTIDEAVNNPYEMDPSGELSGDRAFTLADLESVLRANEFDSELLPPQLRDRLQLLIENFPEFSRVFTTTSVSSDTVPAASSAGGTPFLSLIDLIKQIRPAGAMYTQAQWNQLIAPEIRLGRKLDVNRPIGNLVDDNGNQIIDEPTEVNWGGNDGIDNDGDNTIDEAGEVGGETRAYRVASAALGTIPTDFSTVAPNYTFEEPRTTTGGVVAINGRQILARNLYILLMALSRDLDATATEGTLPSVQTPAPGSFNPTLYKARRLAQWAVNAVDYRDPDSIMTRFVFDDTPFDAGGWTPPADTFGTPAAADHVVWGVEEPQLVFSESLALHDVRLRDTNRDDNEMATKMDTTPDDDSDQVRIPEGSLFLELYCPHPVINGDQETKPGAPQELYSSVASTGVSQLNLAGSAPSRTGAGEGAPIWRIAISERHNAGVASGKDVVDPEALRTTLPDTASFEVTNPDELVATPTTTLNYDRFILFRDFPGADLNPDNVHTTIGNLITTNMISDMLPQQVFFAPSFSGDAVTNADRLLEPGQFLVLAPRIETRLGSKEFSGMVPGLQSDHRLTIFPNEGLIQARHDNTRLTPPMAAAGTAFTPALAAGDRCSSSDRLDDPRTGQPQQECRRLECFRTAAPRRQLLSAADRAIQRHAGRQRRHGRGLSVDRRLYRLLRPRDDGT